MRRSSIVLLAVLVAACGPRPTMQVTDTTVHDGGRVRVERLGIFADETAYGNRRVIYRVTDTKTGTEFIGISGVGISETGSHPSGKTTVIDER